MNPRDRILIFTTDLYRGGVAESTRKLVEVLSEFYDVILVVYDNTPVEVKTKANTTIFLNIPLAANFSKNPIQKIQKKILRLPGLCLALYKLYQIKKKYKPKTSYSLMYIPNLVNIFSNFSLKDKPKIIISERQDPFMDLGDGSYLGRLLKLIYPSADKIHANSYEMIGAISKFYSINESKIFHLDNFFYFDEVIKKSTEKLQSDHQDIFRKPVIATSGRLSKQKGHWHLIYVIKELLNKGKDFNLLIIGDGELKTELCELAISLGISDRVFIIGNVSNPHKYIAKAYAFVFPSIWESFGNSLVEAMSLGVPVISTSCKSGPGYIIQNGKFGIDIGTLSPYGLEPKASEISKICASIESLTDKSIYETASYMAKVGADRFSVLYIKNKILELFNW